MFREFACIFIDIKVAETLSLFRAGIAVLIIQASIFVVTSTDNCDEMIRQFIFIDSKPVMAYANQNRLAVFQFLIDLVASNSGLNRIGFEASIFVFPTTDLDGLIRMKKNWQMKRG
jgi:hypothetical protein